MTTTAAAILEALADGADPFTGEVLDGPPWLLDPRTQAALREAADLLGAHEGQGPPRQGEAWTEEEDAQLLAAFDRGEGAAAIARAHGRSSGAIRSRQVRLGLVEKPGPKGDADFLRAFEAGSLVARAWHHRAHLRVSYQVLREEQGEGAAVERLRRGIRALNARHGVEAGSLRGYHETLTVAWVKILGAAMAQGTGGHFATFIDEHPELLDKRLLRRHYSVERLLSAQARLVFLPPDLEPLPGG